jgi:methionyl aminopeptidase
VGAARAGEKVNAIGREMEREVHRAGFRVIRELASHGVGRGIHEWPSVPNYYEPRLRDRLSDGLVITIEPIIAAGSGRVYTDADGWTIRTADRSLSAHYEHTLLITRGRPVFLTAL